MLAPICLFTYTRLEETKQTVNALKANFLASESDLFVFSDAGKNELTWSLVLEVRKFLKQISGFKSITIIELNTNKGLANSIISGVNQIINKYGKVIVMEDDLITTPNFLDFMNQALFFYENSFSVFSVSGYTMDLPILKKYNKDFYLSYRASSWGWATWKDRWLKVDWEVKGYKSFIWNPFKIFMFMKGGSDLPFMLWKQMNNKIDSWAIRWCFNQFCDNSFTVYPSESKVFNVGIGENSTHTKFGNYFNPQNFNFQSKNVFIFENTTEVHKIIASEFKSFFSIHRRLLNKIFEI